MRTNRFWTGALTRRDPSGAGFLRNRHSEPASRDGDRKGPKMDPKPVHFGARKRPLWGPDSVPKPRPASGPNWVAIWAVWGPIWGPLWGPIWAPFRGRFSFRFSVAVWGAPGANWGPSQVTVSARLAPMAFPVGGLKVEQLCTVLHKITTI